MAKPKKLKYQGTVVEVTHPDGQVRAEPDRYYPGVPARNLDEEDIAALSDDEIKDIMSGPDPLYVDPDAERAKKERAKAREADKQRAAHTAPEPAPEPDAEPEMPAEGEGHA